MLTHNPCADAEAHTEQIEAYAEKSETLHQQKVGRLAAEFIDAAEWGADEPLEKSTVSEALYEVQCAKPELIDALFYSAAQRTDDPVMRALVADIAEAWAEIKAEEKK